MDTEDRRMDYLVIIETQKTKQYLFASPYLRETRGGSVLLDLLNRKETEELLRNEFSNSPYEIVYLGGGSGRILFSNRDHAEQFKQKLIKLYRTKTVNARIAIEVLGRLEDNEKFTDWVSRGVQQTQRQKLGQTTATPILAGRWIRPCSSCGREMAEYMLTEHGEHRLCYACKLKRKEINNLYSKTKPGKYHYRLLELAESLEKRYTDKSIFTTLARCVEKKDKRITLPQDFNDIGDYSRPGNYMGFIYADGNRMGELVKKIGKEFSPDEEAIKAYRAFSEIVDRATREATVEAVLKEVGIKENDYLPVEFIIAGGDDLMLAVPAHHALDVAIVFIEKFQEKTKQLQSIYIDQGKLKKYFEENGLTVSAGIVLAHSHYPASDLMTLSADLMKLAKQKAASLGDNNRTGTLDFMVLYEATTEGAGERRNREYLNKWNPKLSCDLTERPYTVDKAKKLLQVIWELKNSAVPRSKLKALYASLFQSQWQAMFEGQRIKERLKVTGDLEKLQRLHELIDEDLKYFPFRYQSHIWHSNRSGWSTPLTEIIELYDFVHKRPLQQFCLTCSFE